jgi:hypothetical protein
MGISGNIHFERSHEFMIDAKSLGRIDIDKALLDPGSVFATPEALLIHDGLSDQPKIEILRRWAYDASESSVAEEEGMRGENGDLLQRIIVALNQLTGGVDVENVGPTKQHGIPRSAVKPK